MGFHGSSEDCMSGSFRKAGRKVLEWLWKARMPCKGAKLLGSTQAFLSEELALLDWLWRGKYETSRDWIRERWTGYSYGGWMIQWSILTERKSVFTGAVMLGTRREWTVQFSLGALQLPGLFSNSPNSMFYFHCAALYLIAVNCTVLWFYASFLFNKAPHKSSFLLVSTPSTHIILFLILTITLFYAEWYSYPQQTGSFSRFRNVRQMNKTKQMKKSAHHRIVS